MPKSSDGPPDGTAEFGKPTGAEDQERDDHQHQDVHRRQQITEIHPGRLPPDGALPHPTLPYASAAHRASPLPDRIKQDTACTTQRLPRLGRQGGRKTVVAMGDRDLMPAGRIGGPLRHIAAACPRVPDRQAVGGQTLSACGMGLTRPEQDATVPDPPGAHLGGGRRHRLARPRHRIPARWPRPSPRGDRVVPR